MSSDVQTFLIVLGVWVFIACVLLPCVLALAAVYERYADHKIQDAFLTPAERRAERSFIQADMVAQVISEAEGVCRVEAELEMEWALPCAPDPQWRIA